jgi:Flp pilus assembly protein TadG
MMFDLRRDRGAAAVEFALILPVLLLMVLGMLEFSRAYNAQISLSGAAREGAREMAIHGDADDAIAAAIAAAPSVNPAVTAGDITITESIVDGICQVEFKIDYALPLMTGLFGINLDIDGVGVMVCGA